MRFVTRFVIRCVVRCVPGISFSPEYGPQHRLEYVHASIADSECESVDSHMDGIVKRTLNFMFE